MVGLGLPVVGAARVAHAHQWPAWELGPTRAPKPAPDSAPTAVIPCRYCGRQLRVPDRGRN